MNKIVEDNTFTCAVCKKTFNKDWSDEDARKELEKNFPDDLDADMGMVCDNCYEPIIKRKKANESFFVQYLRAWTG